MAALDLIFPVLHGLLGHAEGALDPAPGRSLVQVGQEVAWDDCCDGQVWTRLISITPMEGGGRAPNALCGVTAWQATIGVGTIRCVSVVDDRGVAPLASMITGEAEQMALDLQALQQVILCTLGTLPNVHRVTVGNWTPLGPLGGCAGGEWTVDVILPACGC